MKNLLYNKKNTLNYNAKTLNYSSIILISVCVVNKKCLEL